MDPLNKLVAYRPLLAPETKKGFPRSKNPSGKYIVHFLDGTIKELDRKEITIVWNKLDPDFIPW
jgi:hypothetical protein